MNVLLFANVGSAINGFYHAGDEAMFYETYRYYKNNFPNINLTALVSSVSHQKLNINEQLNLPWPENGFLSRINFIFLSVKVIIWNITKLPILLTKELNFISIIQKQNIIHFTGGGNINSLFPNWLYYSFFIIFIGWLFRKKIILSSQTIGPIRLIDRIFSFIILNLPSLIILRESVKDNMALIKYGVFKPIIKGGLDAAHTLPIISSYKLPEKRLLRIGLSLHSWKNYEKSLIKSVASALNKLSNTRKIEILLIPHIITKGNDEWDIHYMNKLKVLLKNKIHVIKPKYSDIVKSAVEPAITIKWLTSNIDLLITSRYHGIVFATSTNVPCLTFKMREYYSRKNYKKMELIYGKANERHIVNLNQDISKITSELLNKLKLMIDNMDEEKNKLKKINQDLENHPYQLSNFLDPFIKANLFIKT